MMTLFFTSADAVVDWDSASTCDTARYAKFFHASLENGVYLAPSQYEAAFVGAAHTDDDIEQTLDRARSAIESLRG